MVPATRDAHEAKTNIRTSPLPKGDWVMQAREFVRKEWQKEHGVTLSNWQLRKATQTYRAVFADVEHVSKHESKPERLVEAKVRKRHQNDVVAQELAGDDRVVQDAKVPLVHTVWDLRWMSN